MRPEIAAFRELETLVRNLGDQLAGYRKRALTAESRCRTLETELGNLGAERDQLVETLSAARRALADAQAAPTKAAASPASDAPVDMNRVAELERENRELHELLEQARLRTNAVVDRVRFLRQQMTVEK